MFHTQVEFFREKRIRHQVKLARDPELTKLGDKLCDKLGDYFQGRLSDELCDELCNTLSDYFQGRNWALSSPLALQEGNKRIGHFTHIIGHFTSPRPPPKGSRRRRRSPKDI